MQIIDSLWVLLGLDTTKFKQGEKETQDAIKKTREVTDRHTKEMSERAKVTAEAFGKIKNEVLGMLGIALSANGIKQFAERITTSDAAVGRLAKNLGVATSVLSTWEGMATKFGGSASDMDSAFRTAFKIAQDLKMGNGASLGPLGMLFGKAGMGNGLEQLTKLAQSGNVEGIVKLLQAAVAASPDKGLALNWMNQAGFSEQTFNVMREVNDQLDVYLQRQREANSVTEKAAELAIKRQQAEIALSQAIDKVGRAALSAATPALLKSANSAASVIENAGNPQGWFRLLRSSAPVGSASWFLSLLMGAGAGSYSKGQKSGGLISQGSGASVYNAPAQDKAQYMAMLERRQGLPSGLLDAMFYTESSRGKNLRSPKGAKGPFQFMDATAAQYGISGQQDDFYASAGAAAQFMHDLLQKYHGNIRQALMYYNGGGRGAAGMYPESTNYASSIMGRMSRGGSKTDVHIQQVTVNTQATDARGIARDFTSGVEDSYSFAAMSGVGLQ